MTIGAQIREYRKRNKMTQEKLAERLCVSCQAVSKWECGITSPDLAMIEPLTRIFGVTADELLGIQASAADEKKKKYDMVYEKYRHSSDVESGYWWAKDAVSAFPDDYKYLEWLAYMEYQLAFRENQIPEGSAAFFHECMGDSLRHFESILENCTETELYSRAALGKILCLYFTDRRVEADWCAEFEYPDVFVKTAEQALSLFEEGKALLAYLQTE